MAKKLVGSSTVLLTAVMVSVSCAQAAAFMVDPASYEIRFSGVPNAVNENSDSPLSATYTYRGGTLDVYADAAAVAKPAASAGVASGGCTSGIPGSGCAGGGYGALSTVTYSIAAVGPSNVLVPYYFETAGGLTASGAEGQLGYGQAEVQLIAPGGSGLTGFDALSYTSNGTSTCGLICVNGTQRISILSNVTYRIVVSAQADVATNYNSSVTAWADPYIYIDPTFVGGNEFSLLISDGIGNAPFVSAVPLPASAPMFGAALVALGALGYGIRRKTAAAA